MTKSEESNALKERQTRSVPLYISLKLFKYQTNGGAFFVSCQNPKIRVAE